VYEQARQHVFLRRPCAFVLQKFEGLLLNRVFLGNPGTGKTTVAKIYGQLLVELGLLSKGDVIMKTPSDFKGDVLGSSEKQTSVFSRPSL